MSTYTVYRYAHTQIYRTVLVRVSVPFDRFESATRDPRLPVLTTIELGAVNPIEPSKSLVDQVRSDEE